MDKTEKIVKRFLESEDHREIIFEPEGNSTSPDFSINGDTAVEATVLQIKGLDNDKIISLTRTLQNDIFKYSKKKNFRSFKDHKGNSYFLRLKIDFEKIANNYSDKKANYDKDQKFKKELKIKIKMHWTLLSLIHSLIIISKFYHWRISH